jgi:DNA-binding MarR family transcriptional regulator
VGSHEIVKYSHNDMSAPTDVDTAFALDGLLDLAGRLTEMMERGMAERGLTRARAAVIMQLYRHGPSVQREISQALGVTPRYVTGLVDALEAEGWVVRGPHRTDRRATMVCLTESAQTAVKAMDAERRAWAAELFDAVPADDLAKFMNVIKVLDTALPPKEDQPRCPDPGDAQ